MTLPDSGSARILFVVALVLIFSLGIQARTTCTPTQQGQYCVSEIPIDKFAPSYATQYLDQWCWAACISMIFKYHGHPLDQAKIVQAVYGRVVNLPSGNGLNMSVQLNRNWVDDNGKPFTARLTSAYDFLAGFNSMSNQFLVDELEAERPVLVASGTHAMVGTAVAYYKTNNGPIIVNIGVFDPWPGNGTRGLVGCDIVAAHNVCMPSYSPMFPPVMGKFIYAASTRVQ